MESIVYKPAWELVSLIKKKEIYPLELTSRPPPSEIDGQPVPLLGAVAFTYPFNFSGHPAASVPAGFTPNRLPAGLQIVAPRYRDDLVLQAARAYEKARPWDDLKPDFQ